MAAAVDDGARLRRAIGTDEDIDNNCAFPVILNGFRRIVLAAEDVSGVIGRRYPSCRRTGDYDLGQAQDKGDHAAYLLLGALIATIAILMSAMGRKLPLR
jgi:hypothetical protein